MPQNDPVSKMLADAKGALAHANAAFPSPKPAPAAAPAKPAIPSKSSISIGEPEKGIAKELSEKAKNIGAVKNAPKMHSGGPVMADGVYQLKAGEHVLTAPEAQKARRHAMMAAGMKSLAKPSKGKM